MRQLDPVLNECAAQRIVCPWTCTITAGSTSMLSDQGGLSVILIRPTFGSLTFGPDSNRYKTNSYGLVLI